MAQEQAAARRLVVPRWKAAEAAHPGDGPPTAAAAVARPTSTTRTTPDQDDPDQDVQEDRQDDAQDLPPVDLGGFGESDRPDLASSLGSGLLGFHPGMFDPKTEPRRHEPDPEDDKDPDGDAVHRAAQTLGRRSGRRRRAIKRPELVMPKMSPDPPPVYYYSALYSQGVKLRMHLFQHIHTPIQAPCKQHLIRACLIKLFHLTCTMRDSLDSGVRRNDVIEIWRQVRHLVERRNTEH